MPTRPVAQLLGESAELKPLTERLEAVERLQQVYRTIAPEALAKSSRVCAIDGTTVVVCASGGAVAAALRQIAPRLLAGLSNGLASIKQNENQELTEIRIEVQVAPKTPRRPVVAREAMPLDKLEAVAGTLSDSPLKDTMERIVRAPRGKGSPQSKSTREKT